jgi:CheY-like chemotaxis protein
MRRILVIEDEVMIALMLEAMLTECGCGVAGRAFHLQEALRLIDGASARFDAATVDIELDGEPCAAVVAALDQRDIPFIVVTGFADRYLPKCLQGRPLLGKPFTSDDFQKALDALWPLG